MYVALLCVKLNNNQAKYWMSRQAFHCCLKLDDEYTLKETRQMLALRGSFERRGCVDSYVL